ncbi:MAG: hypothetical protein AB1585_10050, partial [Thermodesulfobacteriota bacterium]
MHIRKTLTLILLFLVFRSHGSWAGNLIEVRTGSYDQFTRIVFQFPEKVLFEQPRIEGEGVFSMVFYNSSTTLPPVKTIPKDPSNRINAIDFIQKNSDLTTTVRLSSPHFTLKTFHLSNPHRIVVDAYVKSPPLAKSKQREALGQKIQRDPIIQPQISASQQFQSAQTRKLPDELTTEWIGFQPPKKIYSGNKPDKSGETNGGNLVKPSYWIAGLIVLTAFFIALFFLRIKKNNPKGSDRLFELVGFIANS